MKNIILIGMPFSGKSTIGKGVCEKIGYEFIDTDIYIEENCKDSIVNIFTCKGEAYFRRQEERLIKKLSSEKLENKLIATGGGTPIYFNNLHKLLNIGKVIFLDTDINILLERANLNRSRPLFIENTILSLLDIYYFRYNIYDRANIKICLKDESIEDQIQKILNII